MTNKMMLAVVCSATLGSQSVPAVAWQGQMARSCLHDSQEAPDARDRRVRALGLVDAINLAEHPAQPSTRPRTYKPLAQLPDLPPVPDGFRLQFHTDGTSYSISLKDTLDYCEYAIFSDQDGTVYEATPRTTARVRPLDSR